MKEDEREGLEGLPVDDPSLHLVHCTEECPNYELHSVLLSTVREMQARGEPVPTVGDAHRIFDAVPRRGNLTPREYVEQLRSQWIREAPIMRAEYEAAGGNVAALRERGDAWFIYEADNDRAKAAWAADLRAYLVEASSGPEDLWTAEALLILDAA